MQSYDPDADVGDYLKVFALSTVILQNVLVLGISVTPSINYQNGIGFAYDAIKFSAPAFIFGILYSTIRTTINTNIGYRRYMHNCWGLLFIPSIWWALIYLTIMPNLQQVQHYHNALTFCWQFINGNAAPHLWYNVMMLQFIILTPIFWMIGHWCDHHPRRAWFIIAITLAFELLWLLMYDTLVFHGPYSKQWYLLDRVFLSFLIYGVLGTLAWQYHENVFRALKKYWWVLIILFIITFAWNNRQLFSYGHPLVLANAPYYKPMMLFYDLVVIGLIFVFARWQIDRHSSATHFFHLFATFAHRAFLSSSFWMAIVWWSFGKTFTAEHHVWGILIVYLLTWLMSFASAFGNHAVWHTIRPKLVQLIKR